MSLAAPTGTPAPIVARLNGEINKSLADAAIVGRLRQIGVAPTPLTVVAFNDFIVREAGRWAAMVKISGAKAE
jgi:tripartite-type tricarboxylate transporter receptor subunit TctC